MLNGNMVTKTFRGKYVSKSEHVRQYNLAMVGWLVGCGGGGREVPIVAVPNACVKAATYKLVFRLDVTDSCLVQVGE